MSRYLLVSVVCVALAGCAIHPTGPSSMALPGTTTTFDQFQADDASCQSYAQQTTGLPNAQDSARSSGVDSATVGALVGAAAGALIGAASGNPAAGAAIGGGSGLLIGASEGTAAYETTGYRAQDRYDNAYVQCMYARGHQVPVSASMAAQLNASQAQPAPVQSYPPANTPPPASGGLPIGVPAPSAAYPPPGTPPPPGY